MPARAFFISPESPKYLVFQARRAASSLAACSSAVARFSSSRRSDIGLTIGGEEAEAQRGGSPGRLAALRPLPRGKAVQFFVGRFFRASSTSCVTVSGSLTA